MVLNTLNHQPIKTRGRILRFFGIMWFI